MKNTTNHFIICRYSLISIYFIPTYYLVPSAAVVFCAIHKNFLPLPDNVSKAIYEMSDVYQAFVLFCRDHITLFYFMLIYIYIYKIMIMTKRFSRLRVITIPFCWSPLFFWIIMSDFYVKQIALNNLLREFIETNV